MTHPSLISMGTSFYAPHMGHGASSLECDKSQTESPPQRFGMEADVLQLCFEAQLKVLEEGDYGFDTVYLNPQENKTELLYVLARKHWQFPFHLQVSDLAQGASRPARAPDLCRGRRCCPVLCCVVLCCVVLCCVVLCCVVLCCVVLCCVVLCRVVLCCVVLCCVVLCRVVLCCVVLCCVVLRCAEGAVTRRQWPGCLPTGTGKREGCVCCVRAVC